MFLGPNLDFTSLQVFLLLLLLFKRFNFFLILIFLIFFAGDDSGKIWVYDVSEQLANPAPDEWSKVAHTLKAFKAEDDLDKFAAGSGSALSGPVSTSGPGSLPSLSSLSSSPMR